MARTRGPIMAGKLQTTVIGSFTNPDYLPIRDWFEKARENDTMGSTDLHRTVGVLTQCFRLQTPRKKENKTTKGATKGDPNHYREKT